MAETTASKDDPRITGLRFAKVLVWLVYAYFIVALVILTLAFFLQLFGASTTASFTEWVYRSADRVMEPFRGIFPTREIGDQGSVIDFAVVFAIIMYGIFALIVHALVSWIDRKIVELRADADRARAEAAAAAAGPQAYPGYGGAPGQPGTPGYGTPAGGTPTTPGPQQAQPGAQPHPQGTPPPGQRPPG